MLWAAWFGSPADCEARMRSILLVALFLFPTLLFAGERQAGWMISFYEDSFTTKTFPTAFVQEQGANVGRSTIFLLCNDQTLIAGVTFPYEFLINDKTRNVDFRIGEDAFTVPLTFTDTVKLGNQFTFPEDLTKDFLDKSEAAKNIALRYKDKTAVFPTIGFSEVRDYIASSCNSS